MNEKVDLILDIVKETKEDVKKLKEEQIKQGIDIQLNKESLVTHMKRTKSIEKHLELHEKHFNERLNHLEVPSKVRKFIWDWIIKVGSGASAMYLILQIYKYFKS